MDLGQSSILRLHSAIWIPWHIPAPGLNSYRMEEGIVSVFGSLGRGYLEREHGAHLLEELTLPRPKGITEMWLQLSVLYLVCTPSPQRRCLRVVRDVGPGGACCPLGICCGEACPSKSLCSEYTCERLIVKRAKMSERRKQCRPTVQRLSQLTLGAVSSGQYLFTER